MDEKEKKERMDKYELAIELAETELKKVKNEIDDANFQVVQLDTRLKELTEKHGKLILFRDDALERLHSLQNGGINGDVVPKALDNGTYNFCTEDKKYRGKVPGVVYEYAKSLPTGQALHPRELIKRYGVPRSTASDFLMYLTTIKMYYRQWKGRYVRLTEGRAEPLSPAQSP